MPAYHEPHRRRKKKILIRPFTDPQQVTTLQNTPSKKIQHTESKTNTLLNNTHERIDAEPAKQIPEFKPKQADLPKISGIRRTSLKELGKEKEKLPHMPYASQMPDAKNDFSQEELVKYWTEYAESLTVEKIHLKNTLISCKPLLKNNFLFEVSVYNPSQKDEIFDSSADILDHLCGRLNNNHLKMDIRIVEKDEKIMVYTVSEKYAYLSKKNPNLEKLTDIFNLTIE